MFRKTAALGALMMLLALPAQAYENPAAGFSIKDRSPQLTVQSIKSYSYAGDNFAVQNPVTIYSVYHYTAGEVNKLTGCEFSTAMFDKTYDDLALLQRSELSLDTVPVPLLDLRRYAGTSLGSGDVVAYNMGNVDFDKLKPEISISKIKGRKIITLTYYIGQSDLITYAVKTSFVSDNNILYILSSAAIKHDDKIGEAVEDAVGKAKEQGVEGTADGAAAEDIHKLKKMLDIQYLTGDQVDESLIKFSENKHKKMLRDFRTFAPSGSTDALICHDSMTGKELKLPKEWLYANFFINKKNMNPKDAELSVGFAMPMETAVKMAETTRNSNFIKEVSETGEITGMDTGVIQIGSIGSDITAGRLDGPAEEYLRLLLDDYDTSLTTISFRLPENEVDSSLFTDRNTSSFLIKGYIAAFMDELKKLGHDEIIRLNDYTCGVNITPAKLYIDLDSNVTMLKDYGLNNLFSVVYSKDNSGSVLWLTEKDKTARKPEIQGIVDSWQF